MSTSGEIHLNDVGTVFRQLVTDCGTPVDLSTATSLQICFQKPDQSTFTQLATLTDAASPAYMQTTILTSAVLDQTGCWSWQGVVMFSSSQIWRTNVQEFEVFSNIC